MLHDYGIASFELNKTWYLFKLTQCNSIKHNRAEYFILAYRAANGLWIVAVLLTDLLMQSVKQTHGALTC